MEAERGPVRYCEGPGQADAEIELAALAGRAFDGNLAAHQVEETLGDGQAQAGAAIAAGGGAISLAEGIEDVLLLLGRDADAFVADAEFEVVFAGDQNAQTNAAGFGEFDGIAQQVEEDLLEAQRIAEHFVLGSGGNL